MGFYEYKDEQENDSSGFDEAFKELKELQYFQKEPGDILVKFHPDSFTKRYEFWLTPSEQNNVPDDKKDKNYCIVLKNDKEHNIFADILGSPNRWRPKKNDKIDWGMFDGGVMEFLYGDRKDPETGWSVREYKHLYSPEHKDFFSKLAFENKPFEIDAYPKNTPTLRYHAALAISADTTMQEKNTLRWMSISHKMYRQLVDFTDQGYPIENYWFKITREGRGQKDTRYKIFPVNNNTDKLDHAFPINSYKVPDLEKSVTVSPEHYLWKYYKYYIQAADAILGTHFSKKAEQSFIEYSEKTASAENTSKPAEEKPSIPEAVGSPESAINASFDDEDIPF